jgi:hypothetical protein
MAPESTLHPQILIRLREAFGEPDGIVGPDIHWAIKPGAFQFPVNVLVIDHTSLPTIWAFDPYDRQEGAMHIGVRNEGDIDEFIKRIQERVERARLMPSDAPIAH